MADDFLDPQTDPFRPPAIPTEVGCLHCGQEYGSYLIEWRIEMDADGSRHGFWCCPTPNCGGRGFGFDIFPLDPEYHDERGGWCSDGDGEDDDFDDEAGDPETDDPDDAVDSARRQRPDEPDEEIPF